LALPLPFPAVAAAAAPSPALAAAMEARRQLGELAAQDHRAMMARLHLAEPADLPPPADDPRRPPATRPVPGSAYNWTDGIPGHTIVRSSRGHWSNYDENKADRFPLPDPLRLKNGEHVRDAETWWTRRRPEILRDFETEVYGRIPAATPAVTWDVTQIDPQAAGGTAILRRIVGHIDNARYPDAHPSIDLAVYTPVSATGPVPMIVVIEGGFVWRGPADAAAAPSALQQVLARGWGYATFNTSTVQADSGGGFDGGIIGLMNRGQPRQPDAWGALAAWSWGLSRAIDYFEKDPAVDASRLGVEGHSRWGKTALLAAALDLRWAIVYASCSGEGGAKLHRHDIGESVDNVCGASEYHWMAGNFLKYAGRWDALPVDQHELIALVAPRPVFVTGGTEDLWSDPVGEFKACVAAGPVYRLLGKAGLDTAEMPAPDEELIAGDIAFRLHAGGHTDAPDWPTFLKFADRYFAAPPPAR
jgi:hypothetical protein